MPEGVISSTQSLGGDHAERQSVRLPEPVAAFAEADIWDKLTQSLQGAGDLEPNARCVRVLRACVRAFDFVAMGIGGVAGSYFAGYEVRFMLPALIAACGASKYLSVIGSYETLGRVRWLSQAATLLSACALWSILVAISALVGMDEIPPASSIAFAAVFSAALLAGVRLYAAFLLHTWRRRRRFQRKVAIVGLNEVSGGLITRIRSGRSPCVISGLYRAAGDACSVTHGGLIVKGSAGDLIEHCGTGMHDLIVVALSHGRERPDEELTRLLLLAGCDVANVTERDLTPARSTHLEQLGAGLTVAVVASDPAADHSVNKAVFDRVVAAVLLLVLSPVLLIIAVAIRLDSRGPVLFRQPRCGYKNRTFSILKFRTMYHELGDLLAERQTTRKDLRVTRVGGWLRWASFDELPQLLNVLRGEMSLVGPRPHALGTRTGQRRLQDIVEGYPLRHKVKPGITGLAQINGCRGALHSDDQVVRRVAYDMFYIKHWSFLFDLKILVLTMFRGFGGANTY